MLSSRHLLKNERAVSILNVFTVLKEGKLTQKIILKKKNVIKCHKEKIRICLN